MNPEPINQILPGLDTIYAAWTVLDTFFVALTALSVAVTFVAIR